MPLSADQRTFLLTSFDDIAEALALRKMGRILPDYLLTMYEEPGRCYHNATHLYSCISELLNTPGPRDPHVGLALWFHDAIYDPTRRDNEPRSADFASLLCTFLELPPAGTLTVQRLILATDHRAPPSAPDEALIIDIDLAILGQPAHLFDAYEANIRQEYAHVPDEEFKPARASILRQFLARPTIYYTPHFHTQYESQARANLERSLHRLR